MVRTRLQRADPGDAGDERPRPVLSRQAGADVVAGSGRRGSRGGPLRACRPALPARRSGARRQRLQGGPTRVRADRLRHRSVHLLRQLGGGAAAPGRQPARAIPLRGRAGSRRRDRQGPVPVADRRPRRLHRLIPRGTRRPDDPVGLLPHQLDRDRSERRPSADLGAQHVVDLQGPPADGRGALDPRWQTQ